MSEPRNSAMAKLRRATELALGYPDVTITRAEAHAVLDLIEELLDRVEGLESELDEITSALRSAESRNREDRL